MDFLVRQTEGAMEGCRPFRVGDDQAVGAHGGDYALCIAHPQGDLHSSVRYQFEMDSPYERLVAARIAAGYDTATAAAEALNVPSATYLGHENGSRGLRMDTARRYGRFFKVPPEWLLFGGDKEAGRIVAGSTITSSKGRARIPPAFGLRQVTRGVPILGAVEAGAWREVDEQIDLSDWSEEQLASQGVEFLSVDVLGYERSKLFALRVVGPSMNLHYPEGRYLIIAPSAEAGVRSGDHVVVRQTKMGLVETTVKELVVNAEGRAELWPRSTDKRFQQAVPLNPRDASQDRPVVIGVVVADYGRRQRPDNPADFDNRDFNYAE